MGYVHIPNTKEVDHQIKDSQSNTARFWIEKEKRVGSLCKNINDLKNVTSESSLCSGLIDTDWYPTETLLHPS